MHSVLRGLVLTTLALLVCVSADAADLRVSPTRLEFAEGEAVRTLTINNPGPVPVLIETQAFTWLSTQDQGQLQPTKDLIVSPPIVEIPGQGQKQLRLGFRPASGARQSCELSYRLWVTEVPRAGTQPGPLRLRTRLSLPVFRQLDAGCEPQLGWSWDSGSVVIHNHGDGYAQLQDLTLLTPGQRWPLDQPSLGYLLPGERWQIQLPGDWSQTDSDQLRLRAQSRRGMVELRPDLSP